MSGAGAGVRMADALLQTLGGRTVLLHVPSPAVEGDAGEQVGLGVPSFQDVELGPVVFRRVLAGSGDKTAAARYELLVSVSAVQRIVGSLAYDSAEVLFQNVAGVLVDADVLRVVSVTRAEAFGEVYLYRVGLIGPDAAAL